MEKIESVLPLVKFILVGVALIGLAGLVMSKFSYPEFVDRQIKADLARVGQPKQHFPFKLGKEPNNE